MTRKQLITKKISLMLLLLALLTSCQLAQEAQQKGEEDQLIGALISKDGPLKTEGSMTMSSQGKLIENPEGNRVYGEILDDEKVPGGKKVVFEGQEVIPFLVLEVPLADGRKSHVSTVDPAILDAKISMGGHLKLEASMMSAPGKVEFISMSRVYQTFDGRVYAVPSDSYYLTGDHENPKESTEGERFRIHLKESRRVKSEDGKDLEETREIILGLGIKYPTKSVDILEMDQDHQIINSKSFSVDLLPKEYSPLKEASYLLVESHVTAPGGEEIRRILYEKDDESLIPVDILREDGFIMRQNITINWSQS